jgi:ATP-dependent Clp protease ATP-binding subunit ClpB
VQALSARLAKMELHLQVSEAAYAELAKVGFDPIFGARPSNGRFSSGSKTLSLNCYWKGGFCPKPPSRWT